LRFKGFLIDILFLDLFKAAWRLSNGPLFMEYKRPEKHLSQEGLMETVGFEKAHFRMP